MEDFAVLLENPRRRRRRRRTPPRGPGGRFRKRASSTRRRRRTSTRRRRNPGVLTTTANPRRRRRRRSSTRRRTSSRRRRTSSRRRRNPGFLRFGEWQRVLRRGGQLMVGEFVGDALSRVATRFGGADLLTRMRVPPQFVQPTLRIGLGLLAPPLMKALSPRMFKPDFRATFAAVNVASGLIALTMNLRTQIFSRVGLSDAGYPMLADWETASGGVGDWETASGGVGGYELADDYGPPAGVLGEAPPPGILDYDYL